MNLIEDLGRVKIMTKDKKQRVESGAAINKTDLQTDRAAERGIIHRDYIAHCLRWTHIIKWVAKLRKRRDFSILDIGCGKEFAFLRTLYTNKMKPKLYLAADIRKLDFAKDLYSEMTPNFEHQFVQCNFTKSIPECENGAWDLIVFLEVIEHVSKEAGIQILENISKVMAPETIMFVSTPCFNGSQAGNHVYEWQYDELKDQLEQLFVVEAHYGTFASQRDIEPVFTPDEAAVYEKLKKYYDSNYISTLMAPLHPKHSRNCIYRLKLKN